MVWKIKFQNAAERELAKIGPMPRQRILRFLNDRVVHLQDPCSIGEALRGSERGEFWNTASEITASSLTSKTIPYQS